jgi:leucyl-tRNA synthetase
MQVVKGENAGEVELPYTSRGIATNSASEHVDFCGLDTSDAQASALAWLESSGKGTPTVNYKLRDWLFARQRYWGEPFPVVYPEGSDSAVPLALEQLPVELPDLEEFKPSGKPESPLVNAHSWLQTTDPVGGGPALRDTNTMPQWAGSCWYYLRYIDPHNENACAPSLHVNKHIHWTCSGVHGSSELHL